VTAGKIPADAVGSSEIAANAVGSSELADNAVDTAAIADQAVDLTKLPHGTGSNDGKFLRANNGADPTFETVTSTTINNNADNRIITGSGTANTLNAESNVLIDSSGRVLIGTTTEGNANGDELTISKDSGNMGMTLRSGDSSNSHIYFSDATSGAGEYAGYIAYQHSDNSMHIGTDSGERIHIKSDGKVGIGMSNPDDTLDVNGTFQVSSNAYFSGTIYALGNDIRIGGTGTANALDDYEEGTFAAAINQGLGSLNATFDNSATYTKIGNLVHVQALIQFQGTGNGTAVFLNLPFTHVTDTSLGGGVISFTNVAGLSGESTLTLVGQSGQSYCGVRNKSSNPSISGYQNNQAIYYHFTYQAA